MPPSEPGDTEARPVGIVVPDHTHHLGTLFGGQALAWMDKAALVAAARHARRTVVTARSEQVDFRAPVRQGPWAELRARVVGVGTRSMPVEVELFAEDALSGASHLATRGKFPRIALDAHGRPTPVPALGWSLVTRAVGRGKRGLPARSVQRGPGRGQGVHSTLITGTIAHCAILRGAAPPVAAAHRATV